MERIKTPTRFINKFGTGKDGFTDGNPALGAPSTQLEADWFDNAQEEIANAIELAGITLDPTDMTQLWQAMKAISLPDAPAGPLIYGRNTGNWIAAVPLGGGTMTGPLILSEHPTDLSPELQAATKAYVDSASAGPGGGIPEAPPDGFTYGRLPPAWDRVLPLAGGIMTGSLELAADAIEPMEAVTLQQLQRSWVPHGSYFSFGFQQLIPANVTIGTVYTFTIPAAELPAVDFVWCFDLDSAGAATNNNSVLAINGLQGYSATASIVGCELEFFTDLGDGTGPNWYSLGTATMSGFAGARVRLPFGGPGSTAHLSWHEYAAGDDIQLRLTVAQLFPNPADNLITFVFGGFALVALPDLLSATSVEYPEAEQRPV
jgi:hypothetical protein